jgi:hypothetical protein
VLGELMPQGQRRRRTRGLRRVVHRPLLGERAVPFEQDRPHPRAIEQPAHDRRLRDRSGRREHRVQLVGERRPDPVAARLPVVEGARERTPLVDEIDQFRHRHDRDRCPHVASVTH